ncbi:hypothetical protein [Sorangium sp. So ce1182]|uniref:hypothetical protein n=1 Tax=Sorangium sp. So ce1182 TaxID=3133334 RepID=UPI003F5FE19E
MTTTPETTTESGPSEATLSSTETSPARAPSRRRHRERSKAKVSGDAQRTTSVKELLVEIERLQHRAVVLDKLADQAQTLFIGDGDIPPEYLVGAEGGIAVTVRIEVVEVIQAELRRARDRTREQIQRRLAATLHAPEEEPTPAIHEDIPADEYSPEDEGVPAQLMSHLVSNLEAARRPR